MSAARLLETARAAGLHFEVEGADLIVEADYDPPPELITELRQHKQELIAALRALAQEAPSIEQDPAGTDNLDERAALIEYGANVPRRWAEGYAALCSMSPPTGFSPGRWQRIIDAVGTFLGRWAADAIRCGWSDLDVFGCNPDRPDARFDAMGLVMLLDRCEVIAVDEGGATLRTASGSGLRFHRRGLPADTVPLWQLITEGVRR
jgi:hypothetical protein